MQYFYLATNILLSTEVIFYSIRWKSVRKCGNRKLSTFQSFNVYISIPHQTFSVIVKQTLTKELLGI